MIFVGVDDTDTADSRGTGHLARLVADHLSARYVIAGVTRHQLLLDPRIPYTAKNSCAAIHVDEPGLDPAALCAEIAPVVRGNCAAGSDPGLAVARSVPRGVIDFGRRAKGEVLTRQEAYEVAALNGLILEGLGGTLDGVIGALAAVGLAGEGDDGRYVAVGAVRDLSGPTEIAAVLSAGVRAIRTLDGEVVREGTVLAEKLRPARRQGQPVLFVEAAGAHWRPLKLD